MNSVHEQCPISDSETVLSQKLVKCTVCTHSPASIPRRAQWPCRTPAPPMPHTCAPRASALPCVPRVMPRAPVHLARPEPQRLVPSLMLKRAVAHFKFCIFFFFFFHFSLTLDHFVQISSKPYVLTLTLIFNLKNFI